VANPQAAKSADIQKNLDERNNPLPDYMRDQINLGLTKISAKEYLELVKATKRTQHDRAINEMVKLLNSDTINDRSAEIIEALSNTSYLAFDYKLVSWYDGQGQTNLAEALLTVINSYTLSENQQKFFDNYTDLRNLTQQWEQSGIEMNELDNAQLMQLQDFAGLNNTVAAKAIALQQLNIDYSYIEPIFEPEGGDKSNSNPKQERKVINENEMTLFPNPSDGYFTVEYNLYDPFNKAILVVFDISGRVIEQHEIQYEIDQVIIPANQWPAGQYTVSLFADGKTVLTNKITITK